MQKVPPTDLLERLSADATLDAAWRKGHEPDNETLVGQTLIERPKKKTPVPDGTGACARGGRLFDLERIIREIELSPVGVLYLDEVACAWAQKGRDRPLE